MPGVPGTPADGRMRVVWTAALAAYATTGPTLAEVNNVSNVDISCYLTSDGWTPGLDEGVATDERLCDTQTYEQPGRFSRTLNIRYIENPAHVTDNKAFDTLVPGTTGFLVVRRGPLFDAAFAATTQKVDIWPVRCGQRASQPPEANSVFRIAQRMFVTSAVIEQKAIAA